MDEYNLIPEFRKGSEKAFRVIFDMYYPYLLRFALKLINEREEAEDIVLCVFQYLFSKCATFKSLNNIKAFLFIAVKNRCLNRIKLNELNHKRINYYLDQIEGEVYIEFEFSIKEGLLGAIYKLIEELPLECRRIFKMLYFDELQPTEIAKQLNIATQTVYAQKNRALNYLKSKLINTP